MNQEKYEKRVAFCKEAAELGVTPQRYLAIKQGTVKQSLFDVGRLLSGALQSAASLATEFPRLAIGGTLLGGAGLGLLGAYGVNTVRNQYPQKFAPHSSETSSLREEKIRQLIARYRRAAETVRHQNDLFADSTNPDKSPVDRYGTDDDFGGFGE